MNSQAPIGVFDSGMGGLTVLRALRKVLPGESFIYLGDTARLPYGTKSPETVRQYAVQMARYLVEQQVKLLVIACNTATVAALSYLQDTLPDLPVLGVVKPGALAAVSVTETQRIAVIATETTIASGAYQREIQLHLPNAVIWAKPAGLLVALAEEGMVDNAIVKATLAHYLGGLQDVDTLLLGCTHFPVFKALLKTYLPKGMNIVDSAEATARTVKTLLTEKATLNTANTALPTRYFVTDAIARFRKVGEIFLQEPLPIDAVELIDAC